MGTGGSPAVRSPTTEAAFSYWLLAFSFAVPIEELALNPSSKRLAAMSLNIDYRLSALPACLQFSKETGQELTAKSQ
jgi:hypothetical protein